MGEKYNYSISKCNVLANFVILEAYGQDFLTQNSHKKESFINGFLLDYDYGEKVQLLFPVTLSGQIAV